MELKNYLIELGFIDNNYLDEYIDLILNYKLTDGYSEVHHTIPIAYYYKKYNCKTKWEAKRKYADRDSNNLLVKLLYKDHLKAHWLLYNCTTGYLKQANAKAYKRMLSEKYKYKFNQNLTADEYDEIQDHMNTILISEDTAYWSAEDVKWLLDNYKTKSYTECGRYLNKTARAVQHKIFALGLTKYNVWTEDEINWLKENINNKTRKECADHLNRTVDVINSKASELSLIPNREEYLNKIRKPKKEKKPKQTKEEYLAKRRARYLIKKQDPEFVKKHNEHSKNYYLQKKKNVL